MVEFKSGDYVVPIRANRGEYGPEMRTLVGTVLRIPYGYTGYRGVIFPAGKPEPKSEKWLWYADDLRLATGDEIATVPKPKPLRRGDLVDYRGDVCVVFDADTSNYGGRLIFPLVSKDRTDLVYVYIDDLVYVGSIRKQLKRAKKKVECAK